jgi:GAF domain-containing protein
MANESNAKLRAEIAKLREALTRANAKAARNVAAKKRLEKALEAATSAVRAALDQQTATGEILNVISTAPTGVTTVFDTICRSAARLFDANDAAIMQFDGELVHLVAITSANPGAEEWFRKAYPCRPDADLTTGRAILTGAVVQVPDTEHGQSERQQAVGRSFGLRRVLAVPMLGKDQIIGTVTVTGAEPGEYSGPQIELLKTFADQAVIAIQNVRLFTELQASNRELTSALDTQTATSDILRVISGSQTDVQPVFDAILDSAVRLLGAYTGALTRLEGDQIELAAFTSIDDAGDAFQRALFPQSIHSERVHAQTIRDRAPLNIADANTDPRLPEAQHAAARIRGDRSQVVVPLLRHDEAIGAISVTRREPGGFTDDEIALLRTFADQAVIAIENVRLFSELQARNREVTEALERQTATAGILQVIGSSPTDVHPVFEAIAQSGVRVCGAQGCGVFVVDNDLLHVAATHGVHPDRIERFRAEFPLPLSAEGDVTQTVRSGTVFHLADIEHNPLATADNLQAARLGRYQTRLMVPMVRGAAVLGLIAVTREEPTPFPDRQVELLKTFADQAVIAIENVRLFTELQTSNRELTTALDTQTATSDILRVISGSQTNVQPVFDAIVHSAVRLLGAYGGALTRIAGDQIELAALTSIDDATDAATRALFPRSLQSEGPFTQAIRDRAPINIADVHTDPRVFEAGRALARARGYRSQVVVPMLRHDEAVGTIAVTRRAPGGFTDDEIALLQTFADQAVIAIENARLLSELQARTQELTRSVGELQALGEVGQAISSTLDLQTVLSTIVARATQLADADAGVIYEYDEQREVFEPRATERLEDDIVQALVATPVRKGQGATGRLAEVREPIQVADVRAPGNQLPVRDALIRAGYRALLAVPLVREDHLIGGLTVFRKTPGEFAVEIVDLLKTFATQSALAIQNARLFREIEEKSRQLEVASQHKSEFLASMSHELRTPLNAIIGFSDVLLQGMFGETNEKQTEYLRDILSSGQHLLSLINDILDLSKIEAGRMDLDVEAFDLPAAIDDAMLLMRERAARRGITLERHVDEGAGEIRADQRKVKQVLLNLLSNAVKFTPEGGRIDVRVSLENGTAEISVTDTGIGIAPEDHAAVFEEFRQVGAADKKAEGTGLGLALCRKFVELHGGRIWVTSQIGQGSTFTFTLPRRQ